MATTAKYQSDIKAQSIGKESSFMMNCISPDSSRRRTKQVATPFQQHTGTSPAQSLRYSPVSSHHLKFSQARVNGNIENYTQNTNQLGNQEKLSDRFIPLKMGTDTIEMTESQTLRANVLDSLDDQDDDEKRDALEKNKRYMDYLVDTMNVYTSQEDNLNLTHAFQNERDSYSPLL